MSEEMNCIKFRELLDGYIDDALSNEEIAFMKAHAEACEKCGEELRFSDMIKKEIRGMDDDVVVPLQAQAAWRNAVRKEIKARKLRKAYKAVSSVAAALVVLIGTTFAMRETGALPPKYVLPEDNVSAVMTANTMDEDMAAFAMPETAMKARMAVPSIEFVIESDGETDDLIVGVSDGDNIIKSADITLESASIENDARAIYDLAEEYEGYVSEDIRDYAMYASHAELVSRIPVDLMDDYIAAAENIGKVISVSRFSQNADELYYNIDDRLESKIALSEEISAMVKNADEESILLLNDELNRVYAEIDALTRLAATRDNDLMYAKVKIILNETAPEPVTPAESSLKDRSAQGFKQSLNAVGDFLKDMVVSVAVILPVVLLLAVAALLVVFAAKHFGKRRKGERDE
ncbi:MAG: DUF4349 domain-containing protein [Clostridia bacterium]|nr:DUF4349 domain-containing protein [Clostridia bacterium]